MPCPPSSFSSSPAADADAPKISVLLPTYNYARFLPAAIESVLAQKGVAFELLIADDASTDESAAVLQHYAALDSRIRLQIHPSNIGMVANWNACLRQARGHYVKFLFGDDLLAAPDTLARLAALLDAHPAAALAASSRLLLDDDSSITGWWNDLADGLHHGPELIARCLRTRRNLIGEPSAVLFRRSVATRGFDPALRQVVDLEMWFHLLLHGSLVYTTEPLAAFRRHDAQQTVVNHRHHTPELEMIALLRRYLRDPRVGAHLRPGSFARRAVLFRQLHYARKAGRHRPEARCACEEIRREIPRAWRAVLLVRHRLSRPLENLFRWCSGWLRRNGALGSPAPSWSTRSFVATMTAANERPSLTPPSRVPRRTPFRAAPLPPPPAPPSTPPPPPRRFSARR